MSDDVYSGESVASKVVNTLLENEALPPKPAVQCAWCRQWLDDSGSYIPEPPHDPTNVSHGICASCYTKMTGHPPKQPIHAA